MVPNTLHSTINTSQCIIPLTPQQIASNDNSYSLINTAFYLTIYCLKMWNASCSQCIKFKLCSSLHLGVICFSRSLPWKQRRGGEWRKVHHLCKRKNSNSCDTWTLRSTNAKEVNTVSWIQAKWKLILALFWRFLGWMEESSFQFSELLKAVKQEKFASESVAYFLNKRNAIEIW